MYPSYLRETELKIIENHVCESRKGDYRKWNKTTNQCEVQKDKSYKGQITEEHICAEAKDKNTCFGDSGGPLTVKKFGVHYLAGVTNWGWGCNSVS